MRVLPVRRPRQWWCSRSTTVEACCPSITRPTTCMCDLQCSSAAVPSPASSSSRRRSWDRIPRRRVESEPTTSPAWLTAVTARATISLSISATMLRVWLPASDTSRSWNAALATPNRSGSSIAATSSLMRRRNSLTAARRPRIVAIPRAARGSSRLRASKTSASATLRAWRTRAAVRAVMRSFGSCTTTPPWTPRTTVTRPSASRIRSASRSEGRDTPKRSTRSGSWPNESPSASSPPTISARSSSAICWGFSLRRVSVRLVAATCPPSSRGHGSPVRGYPSGPGVGLLAPEEEVRGVVMEPPLADAVGELEGGCLAKAPLEGQDGVVGGEHDAVLAPRRHVMQERRRQVLGRPRRGHQPEVAVLDHEADRRVPPRVRPVDHAQAQLGEPDAHTVDVDGVLRLGGQGWPRDPGVHAQRQVEFAAFRVEGVVHRVARRVHAVAPEAGADGRVGHRVVVDERLEGPRGLHRPEQVVAPDAQRETVR